MKRRALLFALGAALALGIAPPLAQAKEAPKIVAFGDSITEGYGLAQKDGLVPQLQDWLTRHGQSAEIINAGLSGDTTYGGRIRIKWSLPDAPKGVIVELGGNDLIMGWRIRDIEKNLDSIISQAKAEGRAVLLVGIVPPEGITKTSGEPVRKMWQRLAKRHQVQLLPDLYAPLWSRDHGEVVAKFLQKDGVHLSKDGVRLVIDEGLGPAVATLLGQIKAK